MLRFFETSLDPFREHDESMPPASLIGYYGRYCRQVWPFLVALMTISLVVSLIEVTILRFVGALVDILRTTSPDEVLKIHGGEFLAMALLDSHRASAGELHPRPHRPASDRAGDDQSHPLADASLRPAPVGFVFRQ